MCLERARRPQKLDVTIQGSQADGTIARILSSYTIRRATARHDLTSRLKLCRKAGLRRPALLGSWPDRALLVGVPNAWHARGA